MCLEGTYIPVGWDSSEMESTGWTKEVVSSLAGYRNISIKKGFPLAGVAQWIECQLANQRVADSIPSQGTCPYLGASEGQLQVYVSLSFSLPSPLSKNK